MKVTDLFDFKTGCLPALENTEDGDVPLVYGTTDNNGIVKFVKVNSESQIFKPPLITVSYLGTAFVQVVPFTTSVVDKSNIIILEPKDSKMSVEEMYFYSMQINKFASFGFHYGRRMNMRQLRKVELLPFKNVKTKVDIPVLLPTKAQKRNITHNINFKEFKIPQLFESVEKGAYHVRSELNVGHVPFVSCATHNNGIEGYYDIPEESTFSKYITVTSDGMSPLTTFYQAKKFNGQDNVMICKPKADFRLSTLFYIMLQFRRMRWRYSYGRKCYYQRFQKLAIMLPIKNDKIDEDYIESLCQSCYGWQKVEETMQ